MAVGDGSYLIAVYDSTGGPHGTKDTRLTDTRAGAQPPTKIGSGTGRGVMRIYTNANGTPSVARWSPVSGGPSMKGVSITIGRALN